MTLFRGSSIIVSDYNDDSAGSICKGEVAVMMWPMMMMTSFGGTDTVFLDYSGDSAGGVCVEVVVLMTLFRGADIMVSGSPLLVLFVLIFMAKIAMEAAVEGW